MDEYDYPTPDNEGVDESLAETEKARAEERDERDAAASEETTGLAPVWAHAEEAESLGFHLAWWDEENGTPPLDIVVDLANTVCGKTGYLRALEDYGYDTTAMTGYIGLNSLTGPLVVAALQVLGTLHSHIREDVTKVLSQIFHAIPEATEEEQANFQAAYEALMEAQMAQAKANFEAAGMEVMTFTDPEEAAEAIEDMIERAAESHEDSSLN